MGSAFPHASNQSCARKYPFTSQKPTLIIIHQLCQLCAQKQEVACTGPSGHACNVCWKQKKSCENGGKCSIALLPIQVLVLIIIQVVALRSKRNRSPPFNPAAANARPIRRWTPPPSGQSKAQLTSTSLRRLESGPRPLRAAALPSNSTESRSPGPPGGPRGPPSPR